MPRSLVYRCPTCDRRLAPVQGMLYSTHVVRRTCRGCGDQWQILIAIVIAPRRSASPGSTLAPSTGSEAEG